MARTPTKQDAGPQDEASAKRQKPAQAPAGPGKAKAPPAEYGGPKGLEPTRYGDWERKGLATDF